jgi:HK97 family phage major capsid protein
MSQAIIRLREERGIFPQFANRVPMGSDIIRIPRILTDVTAYWAGENVEITASDPVTGECELMARKLGALTKVSSELDEDAVIEIGNMITTSMAYAEADKIDDAAFNGDSTSTSTLSVSTRTSGSPLFTCDPIETNHSSTKTSSTVSPRRGRFTGSLIFFLQ